MRFLNISNLLNAWVQWEGLTDLGDWTVPYGSDYAETGLYSARGNALLTCVYGSFTLDDVPRAYYSMQLTWQPYAPTPQPGSTQAFSRLEIFSDTGLPDSRVGSSSGA